MKDLQRGSSLLVSFCPRRSRFVASAQGMAVYWEYAVPMMNGGPIDFDAACFGAA